MKIWGTGVGITVLWFSWSGHFGALMLSFALASLALVLWLTSRAELYSGWFSWRILKLPSWLFFLIKEIILSNIDVARRIWSRKLNISPTQVKLPCHRHTDFARALHANSITLTPGTLTLAADEGELRVHALSKEGAESLAEGQFDAAAGKLE